MIDDPKRVILFDLDGTLCYYEIDIDKAFVLASQKAGLEAPPFEPEEYYEQYRKEFERALDPDYTSENHDLSFRARVLAKLNEKTKAFPDSKLLNFAEAYTEIRERALHLYSDARSTVNLLRENFSVGLLTNGPSEVQWRKIDLLEIKTWFDNIVVSGDVGISKPDSKIFSYTLKEFEAETNEAIYVGNSLRHDIQGANNADIQSIWKREDGANIEESDPQPTYTIERLDELPSLLNLNTTIQSQHLT